MSMNTHTLRSPEWMKNIEKKKGTKKRYSLNRTTKARARIKCVYVVVVVAVAENEENWYESAFLQTKEDATFERKGVVFLVLQLKENGSSGVT